MSYPAFVRAHARFLAFGFLAAWVSSFGQTFYISLFGGELRAAFGLSHGGFGAVYSAATLASGLSLIWLGRQIDRIDLRPYTAAACLGLAAACALMASAPAAALLGLALFALRLTGQGLLSHIAVVAMARYFAAGRGKALSLATLGHPAGEAVFPALAVALMAGLGWRGAWWAIAAVLALGLAPLMLWLLRGHGARERRRREAAQAAGGSGRQAALAEVLRDARFYLVSLAVLAPSFIVTGFFFHQVHLAESKGWSLEWLASCFVGYAASTVAALLAVGTLVDRLGAARLLPLYLPPLAAAMLTLAVFDHPAAALAYLLLAGLTAGGHFTITGALWAELYGTAHLGAIRALVQALMVLSTAASPVALGWLLDRGVGFQALALACAAYLLAATALTAVLQPRLRPA